MANRSEPRGYSKRSETLMSPQGPRRGGWETASDEYGRELGERYEGEFGDMDEEDRWSRARQPFGEGRWASEQEGRWPASDRYAQGYGQHDYGQGSVRSWSFGPSGYGAGHRGYGGESRWGEGERYGWGYGQAPWRREAYANLGRGPKGYTRSDERVREDVCDRLFHPELDASEVEVLVKNGEVTFSGTVPERRMKHLIEDLADHVAGVKEIHNQITVKRPDTMGSTDEPRRKNVQH